MRFGDDLTEIRSCPHCSRANPVIRHLWTSDPLHRADGGLPCRWATYACTSCGHALLAKGEPVTDPRRASVNPYIFEIIPASRVAPEELPDVAKSFLQQAYDTLHAPDAAGVMAASAIDAMLKSVGYRTGTLYIRIDKAVEDHVLTSGMGEWAHRVRLEANNVRHADAEQPHLTAEQARQCVEFADALAQFLFVLTARVNEGIANAEQPADQRSVDIS